MPDSNFAQVDLYAAAYRSALEDVDAVLAYYLGPIHAGRQALKVLEARLLEWKQNGGKLQPPTHAELEAAIR